jgi:hypothetical protein
MSLLTKSNSRGSSRRQIAIKGIDGNILELPDGEHRLIMQTSSINLELKSEAEQDAIIETYQKFLNSLACPIQIVVQIREVDIDKYLEDYRKRVKDETVEAYRQQSEVYQKFVRDLIKTNKILTKHFYIVVPYTDRNNTSMEVIKDQLSMHAKVIEQGLGKLGMQIRILSGLEALDLFYAYYNAEQAKLQPLKQQTMHMLAQQFM